jgi:lipoprotein-releasing system permease protein
VRILACLALLAACNSKQPAPKQQAPAPNKPADPWNAPSGSARGSAGDPKWVNDPPDVLRAKIMGVNAHAFVLKKGGFPFAEYRDVLAVVEKTPDVVAAQPFVFVELEVENAGKPPQPIMLKGVDPARVSRILTVGRHMTSGTLDSLAKGEIVIGDVLARRLDVAIGDDVTLRPSKDAPTSTARKPTVLRVGGTFHLDFEEYDERLSFTSLPTIQAVLAHGDEVTGVEMVVTDFTKADTIAKAIETKLGGTYQAMDWYELNEKLFTALGHARP